MLEKLKKKLVNFLDDEKDNPPYDYEFLVSLNSRQYPKYLKKIYKYMLNEELNLKNPKKFNEKIQWLKLYDNLPIKTQLTDKVLVRDWVKKIIGEKYLKPVLWIGDTFDEIPFDKLPDRFIIKANNGCKWHYKIKNKTDFLSNARLFGIVKSRFDGWMMQSFFPYAGFELQYKDIIPKILIEPLLVIDGEEKPTEYEIYCFNGNPKIFQKVLYLQPRQVCVYDENYNQLDLKFLPDYQIIQEEPGENLKLASLLSEKLCKEFKLVRVDWMEYKGGLFFSEMTFTPFSGFFRFNDNRWNERLGSMLNLK